MVICEKANECRLDAFDCPHAEAHKDGLGYVDNCEERECKMLESGFFGEIVKCIEVKDV